MLLSLMIHCAVADTPAPFAPPLLTLSEGLRADVTRLAQGSVPDKAFHSAELTGARPRIEAIATQLQQAGAVQATTLLMEYELVAASKDGLTLYVRTSAHMHPEHPAFMDADVRPGPVGVDATDVERWERAVPGMAAATQAQWAQFTGPDCAQMPWAQPEHFSALPDDLAQQLKALTELRLRDALCQTLSGFQTETLRLRLDDFNLAMANAEGQFAGLLRGSLGLRGDILTVELSGFYPPPD